MKVIAVIPARGGSKRLPNKNVLPLQGMPLIAWTIEAAKKSKYIDDILVSTDDAKIANIAISHSAKVPELRPKELSTDNATTNDVILYTLNKYGTDADIVVILQPTSPFRSHEHIDESLELLIDKSGTSVVSVTECEHPPLWANTLPDSGSMNNFLKRSSQFRSQDLQTFYRLNGAIYIYKIKELLDEKSMSYTNGTYAYKMQQKHSIDIDTKIDFDWAEFLLSDKE
ncbi:acylneuraminate cytidylyltransferase family protein [Pseudoalteromonas fuliginea]|nr:acylneuraminate cytidylyltransferase family protein [Pseudoalteromonas fuliginea]